MAYEKQLRTRIVHKHDTPSHWELAENFIPMQGELIIYDDRTLKKLENGSVVTDQQLNTPVRYKIGDGVTNVNDLPFVNVGESTEGKEFTFNTASETVTVIGGTGAERFNSVTNKAIGDYSHAEGNNTTASNQASHAEGFSTIASGDSSHAEGYETVASGAASHAEGIGTIASSNGQHAQGTYNIKDTASKYACIVGNGSGLARSNAHTLGWDGVAWFAGDVKVGGTGQDDENAKTLATTEQIDAINNVIGTDDSIIGTWVFNDEPDLSTLSNASLVFASNGTEYNAIRKVTAGNDAWGIYTLSYFSNNVGQVAFTNNPDESYGIAHGWTDEIYKTITITEAPTDETFITWLKNNATKQSGTILERINELENKAVSPQISITYSELVALRDNSQLIPGQFYRITDYVCTTTQENTRATNHKFDIIVQALDTDTLSEEARADHHDAYPYFDDNGANLAAWELKYSLDNDTTRFAWADTENGKGVIYWMKDENNNECPYDFKNIQFKRMVSLENGYPEYDPENGEDTWVYTFCGTSYHIDNDEWSELKDGSLERPYGHQSDVNTSTFNNNKIGEYIMLYDAENEDSTKCGKLYLNNNVFFGYWDEKNSSSEEAAIYYAYCCYSNTFGYNCHSNTFGNSCNSNIFGNNCYANTFGEYCIYNKFGTECFSNTFGNGCNHNTFGSECYYNAFNNAYAYNTFGDYCTYNTFGEYCLYNTFGDNCHSNTFGNNCLYNTFGDKCDHNTFGNECNSNTLGNSCNHNTFGSFCISNIFDGYCVSNTFDYDCISNTFGNYCNGNTFGGYCNYSTFGEECYENTFGDCCESNTFGDYCYSNTFGNSCYNNTFGNNIEEKLFGDNLANYNSNIFIEIAYSNLKELRDHNALTPGAFYRITDYQCTTVQENTRAMNNKFDIIVQALSSNTLSEIAKADYHQEEISPGNAPVFNPSVITPAQESIVIPYYYEHIDCSFGATEEGPVEYNSPDVFIEHDYLENNEGQTVPVIYKTHIQGFDLDEGFNTNFVGPDYDVPFFYVGRAEIDGEEYDKWRKIDIAKNSLTWETDAQVYLYTNILVENNQLMYDSVLRDSSDPDKLPRVVDGAIKVYYREFIDSTDITNIEDYDGLAPSDNTVFVTYGYEEYNGATVPVLYEIDPDSAQTDFEEPFYYVGTASIDGATYDKWRNVEHDNQLTLDSKSKLYYYTNVVVDNGYPAKEESGNSGALASANIPAWEIKYSLDNDTTRFAWADEENGKGVIYYMKDEHNNECPYDFKNIQFKRWAITGFTDRFEGDDSLKRTLLYDVESNPIMYACKDFAGRTVPSYVEIGDSQWCYTFAGYDTSDSLNKIEWYDMSIPRNPSIPGDGENSACRCDNNIIKALYKDFSGDDLYNRGYATLNNIVFYGGFYDKGNGDYSVNLCYSNIFGNDCYSNTFGDFCYDNTFGNSCFSNTFGDFCYDNTFGNSCYSNTFGDYFSHNTFGNNCSFNTFGGNYSRNTFGNDCISNTFGDSCHSNTFGNSCMYNTFGDYFSHNTFGNNCDRNTFGTSKTSTISYVRYICFENDCEYIKLLNSETGSFSNYVQDIVVSAGVRGTSDAYHELQVSRNAPPVVYEAANTTHIILD